MVRMDTAPLDKAPPSISLKHYRPVSPKDMILATADFQTAGRGQAGNSWESEAGKNLLFGLLFHPREVEANRQFIPPQAMALSVCETLSGMPKTSASNGRTTSTGRDRKICGMLIENTLIGRCIENCIIGAGININQQTFCSDAPIRSRSDKSRKRRGTGIHLSRHHQTFQGLLPEHPTRPNGGHRP